MRQNGLEKRKRVRETGDGGAEVDRPNDSEYVCVSGRKVWSVIMSDIKHTAAT